MATKKNPTTTATSMVPSSVRPPRLPNARMVQNFHLVWLDGSIDEINNDDCRKSITQLRQVTNTVNTFTDVDECIDFITDIKEEKTFMIVSRALCQIIVSIVQDLSQVSSIYIFCENKAWHEQWAQEWSKVKGVYTDITPICEALKKDAQACDHNSVSLSFVKKTDGASNQNLDQLDQSFMYTQILKEILLTIDFEQKHMNEFLTYYREQFVGNTTELKSVDKIEKEYPHPQPIWWYTYQCFLYSMLNRALRTMEVDLIIKMGFFIRDLHNHIATLHAKQYGGHHHSESFIVYRGQGLSQTDFDQLMKTKGGLISFNNFLSTTLDRAVSLAFAESNQDNPDLIGILFEISINPSISSSPFASVGDVSYYHGEEEILFSMHSVFRIGQVTPIDKNGRLWQVYLTLISKNDAHLHALTEFMRKETFSGCKGWDRLGMWLIKVGYFNKAEELYEILLLQTTNEGEKAHLYHMLGMVKHSQGKCVEAVEFYKKSIKINQKILSPTHSDLVNSYGGLGNVYNDIGEHLKALSYYEKVLEIYQKSLHPNHPLLATSHNNIGTVYNKIGEYSEAISSHEKALELQQKTLPANHTLLATSYNNIGTVYDNMGEYSKAISYYEKALEIYQTTLPANHPDFAHSYNNIGSVYNKMSEYSKALSYYEKAHEVHKKTLSSNDPFLAMSYNNISFVYNNMGEYSKALSSNEKALEIKQKTLPANHPHLTTSYAFHGSVYNKMGKYSKALLYYEKALEICQTTLPANHPDFAHCYNNIGSVYKKMTEYSKALSYYKKALQIRQKTLPSYHPHLATSYSNIAAMYYNIREYSKALSYDEKALEICQTNLPANHPHLAASYNNIGLVYTKMGEYSKALSYYEKAHEIDKKTLSLNHPLLATSYNNIGFVYNNMGEYSKALSYYKKALQIRQKTLPPYHPHLGTSYNNIAAMYYNIREYSKAFSFYFSARDIWRRSLPPSHPNIKNVGESIEFVKKKL